MKKKWKRILAGIGALALFSLYLITLILGLFGSPATTDLLMASIASTVIIPVFIYAMMLLAKVLSGKREDQADSEADSRSGSGRT